MAKTIVALYQTYAQAQEVVADLEAAGFGQDHVQVTSNEMKGGPYAADAGDLPDSLTDHGVPDDEADFYAEGVRRGSSLVVVRVADADADRAYDVMTKHESIDYDRQSSDYRSSGFAGYDRTAPAFTADEAAAERERYRSTRADEGEATAKVVREDLKVGKREVAGGGVRLHTRVVEEPVEQQLRLREERVTVDRQRVDRPATEADLADAFREQTFELTETNEQAVVQKEARVVEEISLDKRVDERTETVRDTVRRTEVEVEQLGADDAAGTFARTAMQDARYRGRSFADAENDLRADYQRSNPGGVWDEVKAGVRDLFDRDRDGHVG